MIKLTLKKMQGNIALQNHSIVSICSKKENRQKAFLNEKLIQINVYLHEKSEREQFSFKLKLKNLHVKSERLQFSLGGEKHPSHWWTLSKMLLGIHLTKTFRFDRQFLLNYYFD